ncbi:MAG: hypothetical protein IJ572_03335 [Bacilli bacterium]|nr:hypothetical protein [Bacilli bacterium]
MTIVNSSVDKFTEGLNGDNFSTQLLRFITNTQNIRTKNLVDLKLKYNNSELKTKINTDIILNNIYNKYQLDYSL